MRMKLIDRFIVKKGEKKLKPFKSIESVLNKPEFSNYYSLLPFIKKCYGNAVYWHGTGRYQYDHRKGSRYEEINSKKCIDILESIIAEKGLLPHYEPWLKKMEGISLQTISLTPFRMYGKLYAGLYLYEKDVLAYQYGTSKFWFQILLRIQLLNAKFLWYIMNVDLFRFVSKSSYEDIKKWLRSIRSDMDDNKISPFQGHLIHSDIQGNYPILIGIKKDAVQTISFNSAMERLETRTSRSVSLNGITHLEVPLNKIKETENFLIQNNISLPIIPLEFGELYCSTFQLADLLGIN